MTIRHLEALVTLAEVELQRSDFVDRSGVYRALLHEAMPYLQAALTELVKERDRVNDDRYVQGLPDVEEVTA